MKLGEMVNWSCIWAFAIHSPIRFDKWVTILKTRIREGGDGGEGGLASTARGVSWLKRGVRAEVSCDSGGLRG